MQKPEYDVVTSFLRTPHLFRRSWRLIAPYWTSEEKYKAWGLLITAIVLNLVSVWFSVRLNKFSLDLYNALEKKSYSDLMHQIYIFLIIILCVVPIFSLNAAVTGFLEFRWRKWLTEKFLNRWTTNNLYYHTLLKPDKPDNPDQRISQDLNTLPSVSLGLFMTTLTSITSFCSFSIILWNLSQALPLKIFGQTYNIQLFWITIVYATIGTLLIFKIGMPLINLSFMREVYEANFRYSLIRLQDKREEVAMFHGVGPELATIKDYFLSIRANFYAILIRSFYINVYRNFYFNFETFIPIGLAAPSYFAGAITLGVVMQISNAFGNVVSSLSMFISQFTDIMHWCASVKRLLQFEDYMNAAELDRNTSKIQLVEADSKIAFNKLDIDTPLNVNLLNNVNFTVKAGDRVLLIGHSGIGKSTLLRALSGLWVYGKGKINLPKAPVFFVPQRPYMPITTLKEAILYPSHNTDKTTTHEISNWLDVFELGHLKQHLDELKDWSMSLSLGEQQRISFIRILLNKPKWIVMDEPTSSLNPALEKLAFGSLIKELKDVTIITVGHSESLKAYHSSVINMENFVKS